MGASESFCFSQRGGERTPSVSGDAVQKSPRWWRSRLPTDAQQSASSAARRERLFRRTQPQRRPSHRPESAAHRVARRQTRVRASERARARASTKKRSNTRHARASVRLKRVRVHRRPPRGNVKARTLARAPVCGPRQQSPPLLGARAHTKKARAPRSRA